MQNMDGQPDGNTKAFYRRQANDERPSITADIVAIFESFFCAGQACIGAKSSSRESYRAGTKELSLTGVVGLGWGKGTDSTSCILPAIAQQRYT